MIKKWEGGDGVLHSGPIHASSNEYDVIDCSCCSFKHIIPIPTEAFLEDYYANEFVKNRQAGFYKKIEEDALWWEIFYNEKYDLFEKHVTWKNPSILDVGSGQGYFLKRGKERGWKTLGIEPSKESTNYSRNLGLEIENDYLSRNNYQKYGQFDVVHMHEVIEHLPDPKNILSIAKELLNPNGLLCIVSPNEFNPLQEAFVENSNTEKWWIAPPEHINYFSISSVKKMLVKNGFSILEQSSTFPIELFLLMGFNYVGNSELGREMHGKRKQFEMAMYNTGNDGIRRKLYQGFSKLSLGREFVIIARRKS